MYRVCLLVSVHGASVMHKIFFRCPSLGFSPLSGLRSGYRYTEMRKQSLIHAAHRSPKYPLSWEIYVLHNCKCNSLVAVAVGLREDTWEEHIFETSFSVADHPLGKLGKGCCSYVTVGGIHCVFGHVASTWGSIEPVVSRCTLGVYYY